MAMSRTLGLVFCLGAALVSGAAALVAPSGRADEPKAGAPKAEADKARPSFSQLVTLPSSDDLELKLEAAPDYVRGGDWDRAARVLQWVLDHPEDAFVPVSRPGRAGKASVGWVSARTEAARLLGTLSAAGLEVYEVQYGPKAAALLATARKRGDVAQLAQVAERYTHTAAGRQAGDLLGTHYLDRGRYATAVRYFRRLLKGPGSARLEPLTLFKACLALHRAGDPTADETWKLLAARAPRGLVVNGRQVSLADLQKELTRGGGGTGAGPAAYEWRVFRGSGERSGAAPGRLAGLRVGWDLPTVRGGPASEWITNALARARERGQVILPAGFPLSVGGKIIYRDHSGVRAVEAATGKVHWESSARGSLDELTIDPANLAHTSSWAQQLLQSFPHVLVENSTASALSADARQVYVVEDLAVLPVVRDQPGFVGRGGTGLDFTHAKELTDAVYHSRLFAIDLETGRAIWEVGCRSGPKEEPLHDAHFLGPPLPLGGQLYALIERQGALRLVCLDPTSGRLAWAQTLAVPKQNVLIDGARRTWAAHPAHAEGVLVCPTNTGAVIAVDLAARGLLWAHSYRDDAPPAAPQQMMIRGGRFRGRGFKVAEPPLNLEVKWKLTAPIIAGGKVVLAAPDGAHLDCLDLWTGELLWRVARQADDLYVGGVYKDRLLVVGRKHFGALRLDKGEVMWGVDTGEPSGQGVLVGGVYYLPVKSCPKLGGPALHGIDLEKGTLVSRIALPGDDQPGNLMLVEGRLISQTATRIAAYPCAEAKAGD
jgi:outer membrane protein assembly factor BamB